MISEPEKLPSPAPEKPTKSAKRPTDGVKYRIVSISQLKADIAQPASATQLNMHPDMEYNVAPAFVGRHVIDARGTIGWQPLSYAPLGPSAVVCHCPAYFAQPRLERYGQSHLLQPVWSGAQFYGTVIALPAMWMIRRPWNHVCRDPMTDPAGFDATAQFFRPPVVVSSDGPEDTAPETP